MIMIRMGYRDEIWYVDITNKNHNNSNIKYDINGGTQRQQQHNIIRNYIKLSLQITWNKIFIYLKILISATATDCK